MSPTHTLHIPFLHAIKAVKYFVTRLKEREVCGWDDDHLDQRTCCWPREQSLMCDPNAGSKFDNCQVNHAGLYCIGRISGLVPENGLIMEISPLLDKLDPSIRGRADASLKATLEPELTKSGMAGNPAALSSRSVGVFSCSKTSAILRDPSELLRNITTIDETAFCSFVKHLSTLKQLKSDASAEVRQLGNG